MKYNFESLKHTPLFYNLQDKEISSLLECMGSVFRIFQKEEFIVRAGDPAGSVGILLSGRAQIFRENMAGERNMLAEIREGDLFAEAFACAGIEILPVSVYALEKSEVLLLDIKKILSVCSLSCPFHTLFIENLLKVLARKNIGLNKKIHHISHRTLREKVLSYLEEQALQAGNSSFYIPFDRQALADYLCADRSALSRELSKMQNDGIIEYKRNYFILKYGNP